jgi:riboflavin kinase/FMN adenylyltransferase
MSEYIEKRLNTKAVFVGSDFRFGAGRAGDVDMLRNYCEERGVECHIISKLSLGGTEISSTVIRKLVEQGEISELPQYLGRYYSCIGEVVKGDGQGNIIGFPTANLNLFSELLPPDGVYAGYLLIDELRYVAMIYIGLRPTVNTAEERRFEVHILGLEGKSLYGHTLEVYIVQKIREDIKFSGMEELKKQLAKDRKSIINIMPI